MVGGEKGSRLKTVLELRLRKVLCRKQKEALRETLALMENGAKGEMDWWALVYSLVSSAHGGARHLRGGNCHGKHSCFPIAGILVLIHTFGIGMCIDFSLGTL